MSEYEMLVNIKLPSKRAYGVAWAVAKLKGYDTLDQWINDLVVDALEMYPDGRAGLDTDEVDWGFETRQQIEKERLALK